MLLLLRLAVAKLSSVLQANTGGWTSLVRPRAAAARNFSASTARSAGGRPQGTAVALKTGRRASRAAAAFLYQVAMDGSGVL